MDLAEQELNRDIFWILKSLKKASSFPLPDGRFVYHLGSSNNDNPPDFSTQQNIFNDLAQKRAFEYETMQTMTSALMSKEEYNRAISLARTSFLIKLINPTFDKLYKKYSTSKSSEYSEAPNTIIFFNDKELIYKKKPVNISPESVGFILIQALYELKPQGGSVKYNELKRQMNKLGIQKVAEKKPVSEKMIREAVYRLKRKRLFLLPDGSSIFEVKKDFGISFLNPAV